MSMPERGSDGRFKQIYLSGAGFDRGVDHGALFHAGYAAGHAGQHAGLEEAEGGDPADQLAQHLSAHLVVRDHAGADRMDRDDIGRRAAEHLLRVLADLQDLAAEFIDGNDRRLPKNNAFSLFENER